MRLNLFISGTDIRVWEFATDNLVEEYADLKKLKAEKFCPEDIWILVNENK